MSTTEKVAKALEAKGEFTLKKNHPHPNRVHQAVHQLRKDGMEIKTRRTESGVVYTVAEAVVPKPKTVRAKRKKPGTALAKVEPTPRHPSLGDVRITSLGEHPSGRIVCGIRDGEGRRWLALLVEEDDL